MQTNQDLFKQAILDAKAVRETAMAAAKTALAEHFEPKIKEMMRQQLSEDMEENIEESLEEESKMEEGVEEAVEEMAMPTDESSMMDEAALDEILAELNALSEDMEEGSTMDEGEMEESIEEGHTGYDNKIHEAEGDDKDEDDKEDADEKDSDSEESTEGGDEASDDEAVVDITVGELKDIIHDVFMQLQGGGVPEGPLDADTDLAADLGTGEEEKMDEISLDEILAELEMEENKMEESVQTPGKSGETAGEVSKVAGELNEAIKTIQALKAELNEVNLLNAKMLYVNKIFKAKNLSESEKTKVINAFDRATTVKEAENTYKTLSESYGKSTKTAIKESIGFASKPIGAAPAKPIVEADAFVARWQKLAGIN